MNTQNKKRARSPLWRIGALGAGLTVALAACDVDRIMEIDDPEFPGADQVPVASTGAGAIVELQRGYSGAASHLHDEGYLTVSAALSDEFVYGGTFTTRIALDRRGLQPPSQGNITDAAFRWLQRARRAAIDGIATLQEAGTTSGAALARLHAVEAYSYVALGEGFCGAVPISNLVGLEYQHGEPLSTAQLFQEAITRFDRGLTADAASHVNAVGKARALLNLGRYADAAAAVADVPTSFIFFFEHDNNASIQRNNVSALMDNGRWTVPNVEGGNGMAYRGGDPRTPWLRVGQAFDASIDKYVSQRYRISPSTALNNAANVVLADGLEARLIQAEAAFHAGGDWLAILNDLRANFVDLMSARYGNYEANLEAGVAAGRLQATLPPLTDPGNDAARVNMIFQERAFWLYLTGHRLGDMRRLTRPVAEGGYGRAINTVFPTGAHPNAGTYGNDVAFPIPFDEENNPHFSGEMCDTTRP
jgi:starch-binding outer membrane protein, SusD/RagB family